MQPNQIILAVDVLNTGVTTNETYDRFEEFQNRSTYIGATHTPDARDTINMYRSFPSKSGNFKGVAKTSVKLSRDLTVAGADGVSSLTAPIIVEVNFSIPVGATPASVLLARQRAIALLDKDTVMSPLNNQLMI